MEQPGRTWAINLHISNNEGDYRYFCDVARECIEDTVEEMSIEGMANVDDAIGQFADRLKTWTEEVFDSVINSEEVRAEVRQHKRRGSHVRKRCWLVVALRFLRDRRGLELAGRDEIARSLKVAAS